MGLLDSIYTELHTNSQSALPKNSSLPKKCLLLGREKSSRLQRAPRLGQHLNWNACGKVSRELEVNYTIKVISLGQI